MKKRLVPMLLAALCVLPLFSSALAAEPSLAHADMKGVRYIYMEGTRVALLDSSKGIRDPLLYGDTVYIPLWTVGMWAGADVRWDQADRTVTITRTGDTPVYLDVFTLNRMDTARQEGTEQYQTDLKNGVEVQLLSDAAVAADGTVRPFSGRTACPLLFRDEVYLPAPYVAELLGKQMLRVSEDIYFYEAPAREDLLETEGYLSAVRSRLNSVRTVVKGEAPKTMEEYEAKVRMVQTHLKEASELPVPAFKGFACFAEQLRNDSLLVLSERVDPYLPVEESSGAAEALGLSPMRPVSWDLVKREDGSAAFRSASSQEPAVDPQKAWAAFSEYMIALAEGKAEYTTYFLSLEDTCAAGEEFLTAVRSALPDDAFAAEARTVHTATQTPPYVYIEGESVLFLTEEEGRTGRVGPLTYNGATYIPLTTVGSWLGMDAVWNEKESSVNFASNGKRPLYYDFAFLQENGLDFLWGRDQFTTYKLEGVDAQLYSETVLTVNGQDKGFVSSLLFREELYLPLDGVAGLMGKQYLRFGNDIHLYDIPTQKQLAEVKNYLSPIPEHLKAVRDLVTGDAPRTEEEFLDRMRRAQRELMAVWEAPVPSFGPIAPYVEDIRYQTLLVLNDKVDFYLPEEERSGTAQALSDHLGGYEWKRTAGLIPNTFLENWEEFTGEMLTDQYNVTTYFMDLERAYQTAWSILEEVRAALPDDAFAVDSATYTDADQIVYEKAVTVLSQLGVISGKEDGSFDPQGLVTRAECAKLLVALRCGGNPERIPAHEGSDVFSDIRGHWAEDYISYGTKNLGLLTGRGDGTFDPDAPVTGLELAKMALASLGYDPVAYQLTGPNWASQTNRLALMVCDPSLYEELGEDVAVSEPITREVAAQILYNTLFNGVVEVRLNTDPAAGETANTYVPKRDENGQDVPFCSVYFDAAKWDVLSTK